MAIPEDKNKQAELDALRQQIDDINTRVNPNMTVEPSKEYLTHLEDIPSEIKRSVNGAIKTLSGHFMKQKPDKILKESGEQTQELITYLTENLTDRQKSLADEVEKMRELQNDGNGSLLTIANSLTDIPEKLAKMIEGIVTKDVGTKSVTELIRKIEEGSLLTTKDLLKSSMFPSGLKKTIEKWSSKVKEQDLSSMSDIEREKAQENQNKLELKDSKFRDRILQLLTNIEYGEVKGITKSGREDRRVSKRTRTSSRGGKDIVEVEKNSRGGKDIVEVEKNLGRGGGNSWIKSIISGGLFAGAWKAITNPKVMLNVLKGAAPTMLKGLKKVPLIALYLEALHLANKSRYLIDEIIYTQNENKRKQTEIEKNTGIILASGGLMGSKIAKNITSGKKKLTEGRADELSNEERLSLIKNTAAIKIHKIASDFGKNKRFSSQKYKDKFGEIDLKFIEDMQNTIMSEDVIKQRMGQAYRQLLNAADGQLVAASLARNYVDAETNKYTTKENRDKTLAQIKTATKDTIVNIDRDKLYDSVTKLDNTIKEATKEAKIKNIDKSGVVNINNVSYTTSYPYNGGDSFMRNLTGIQ